MMMLAQTQPDAVFLMSWLKPVLFALTLVGWAWVVSHLDKDAAYYYLQRQWLGLGHLAVGVVAFGLMLLIPYFFIGWFVGLVLLAGGIVGYAAYRNSQVPEEARWTASLSSFTNRIDAYQHSRSQRRATMTLLDPRETRLDVPMGEDANTEAHVTLEEALDFAFARDGEQVDIAVDSNQAAVSVWVDGVRYPQPTLEPALALKMVDYLKDAAKLDVADRRKRQAARIWVVAEEYGRHRLDLETAGSTKGLTLSLVIDRAQRVKVPLDRLGLLDQQRQQLKSAIDEHGRVIVIAAPSGQGTTTTLYSLLEAHDPYTTSVVTLEHEIAYDAEGVSHNLLEEGTPPQQVNERLGAMLRSDPGVLMLDNLTDAQTAQLVAQSAEETRFYVPFNEKDTFSALNRWVKLVGSRKLAAESLGAVVAQRLVRRLCPTCRTPYKPDPGALKKLNLPVDRVTQLYQASGQVMVKDKPRPCPACHGMAYRGRVAVFEVMPIDQQARTLIAAGDVDRLRSHLRKQKMLWMQEAALFKVVEGVTDVKEITRALNGKLSGGSRRATPNDSTTGGGTHTATQGQTG